MGRFVGGDPQDATTGYYPVINEFYFDIEIDCVAYRDGPLPCVELRPPSGEADAVLAVQVKK